MIEDSRDHSSLLFGLSSRSVVLYLQRLRLFLICVLFSLSVSLSFLASNSMTGKMSAPMATPFQQQQKPNSRPPPSKKLSNSPSDGTLSVPPSRVYYNVSSPYNNIITDCSLVSLGERYNDDKFTNHNYQNLYCEVLRDFQRSQRKMRMLEIGFGCGHNVNTPNQQGVSALIWKEYFGSGSSINSSSSSSSSSPSSGIDLYEVDLISPAHLACVNKYLANHTSDIVQSIYLGDQSNKPFLTEVRGATNPLRT